MGRGKPQPPKFTPSEIKYGDQTVGKTYQDPTTGNIVNQYIPDPEEVKRKQEISRQINQLLQTVGITPPELLQEYKTTESTFINDATSRFNEQYNPLLKDLRENTAARFGTLNTSQFIEDLGQLEKNRTQAITDIATKGQLLKHDLVNQSEARKLQQLQTLGGTLNADQSNFLSGLNAPLSASNMMNDFLNSQYLTQLQDYRRKQDARKAALSKIPFIGSFLG